MSNVHGVYTISLTLIKETLGPFLQKDFVVLILIKIVVAVLFYLFYKAQSCCLWSNNPFLSIKYMIWLKMYVPVSYLGR